MKYNYKIRGDVMCKSCNNCKGFIPKSAKEPYNAFDYLVENKVGVCNFTEDVTPLYKVIKDCKMWEEIR